MVKRASIEERSYVEAKGRTREIRVRIAPVVSLEIC